MSYFLIIRWDPPINKPILKEDINEVSTYSPNEDFGFIDESIQNEPKEIISDSLSTSCASSSLYEIDSNNWKISIDLEDGSLDETELKNYPDEMGSGKNKLMFDACGRNEYSQLSGFVFGKNADKKFTSFKIEDITKSQNENRYTFVRESTSIRETKIISFDPENYFVGIQPRY
jgi:hypothetical protein